MFRRTVHRFSTAALVVLSLLFSQLALAMYVCPASSGEQPVVMKMAPGEPCEGMAGMKPDPEQPALCHQHCADAPQSFDPVQAPVVSLPAVVQVLLAPLLMDAGAAESVVFAQAGAERPPPDPLFLSTLRLRV